MNPASPADVDRYAYVGGDPINAIDPAGTSILKKVGKKLNSWYHPLKDEINRGVKRFIDVPRRVSWGVKCGRALAGHASGGGECDPLEFLGFDVEDAGG